MFMFQSDVAQLDEVLETLEFVIVESLADAVEEAAPGQHESMEVIDTIYAMYNSGMSPDVEGVLEFMELYGVDNDDGSISTTYTVVE